jgi:hypothetical protein
MEKQMGTLDYKIGKNTQCGSRVTTYSPKKVGESKVRSKLRINICKYSIRWSGKG